MPRDRKESLPKHTGSKALTFELAQSFLNYIESQLGRQFRPSDLRRWEEPRPHPVAEGVRSYLRRDVQNEIEESIMPEPMAQAQARINERQTELHRVADVLAREAQYLRRRGGLNRVALIALGALTATQAGLEQLDLMPKAYLSLLFLVMGVLVAVIAGVEAAFKFESKGAELLALATSCHSMVRQADSVWYRNVGAENDPAKQLTGAHQVIEFQQAKLDEVQEKAAALGINVALEVRRVHSRSLQRVAGRDDDDDDDDNLDSRDGNDPETQRRRRPYAA